jgi:[acyl-carrier-protein] S-malonyltransferase
MLTIRICRPPACQREILTLAGDDLVMSSMPPADAILFPGQGSQQPEMRERVAEAAPDLLALAADLVGDDPFERLNEGTLFVQVAVFCASVASWRTVQHVITHPVAYAGHSLGEFAALVAAGTLDAYDALRLVVMRGRLTEAEAKATSGGMLALLGGDMSTAEMIARRCGLTVANDNCPGQVVLSGPLSQLADAEEEAHRVKVKFATLDVEGAFHSPLMKGAAAKLADELLQVRLRPWSAPVISCLTAKPFEDIPCQLAESLTSAVRWREVLQGLNARGATRFIEVGPGRVLTNLVRRTLPGIEAVAVERGTLALRAPDLKTYEPMRVSGGRRV